MRPQLRHRVSHNLRAPMAAVCAFCTLALALAAPTPGWADDQTFADDRYDQKAAGITGEVWVLLASGEPGTIDPSLSHLRGLKQPPFNEYKSMKVLSHSTVPLPMEQAVEIELPKRRTLLLRLLSRLPDGRAKLQLSITRLSQKDALPLLNVIASDKQPFFVAGQKFEGGTLVIGVRVTNRGKPKP